jgi:hypothetical protein
MQPVIMTTVSRLRILLLLTATMTCGIFHMHRVGTLPAKVEISDVPYSASNNAIMVRNESHPPFDDNNRDVALIIGLHHTRSNDPILATTNDTTRSPKRTILPLPKRLEGITTIVSSARDDRSGAAILNYLMAHLFAFQYGLAYGGVCGNTSSTLLHRDMVAFLGLEKEIPFRCSDDRHQEADYKDFSNDPVPPVVSPEWVAYIRRSRARRQPPAKRNGSIQVAVHVRRGDVTTCHHWRYLPNVHYLKLIETYSPEGSNVTIYTEGDFGYESLDDFAEYNIHQNGSLQEVWTGMLESDILIMSKSDFSFVPGILGTGRVLYTPFWNLPLSDWETVDTNITDQSIRVGIELKQRTCGPRRNKRAKTPSEV